MNPVDQSLSSPTPAPTFPRDRRELRILVGIASFGNGHLELLKRLIADYQKYSDHVDVVVFSDGPKVLGEKVEVIVGLPSKNPWSLPFAHKKTFAARVDKFDVFIYSEDDIGFHAEQLDSFLRVTSRLPSDEIAGYLRYEIAQDGTKYLTEPWQHFHWVPESARTRGEYTVAQFTNEHAGFYVLTQAQLRRAIASGGFVREPYTARYRLPETAATDPYTSCGFKKVVPISHLNDFLVHHIPNKYVNFLPVTSSRFAAQIKTLEKIRVGEHPGTTLCAVEPSKWFNGYQKSFYEKPSRFLSATIPDAAKTVLSVGAGWGALETDLIKRGKRVTALPLDSVFGADLQENNIEVILADLENCFSALQGRTFDCVVMTNLLHLQANPAGLLEQLARFISLKGSIVLAGPNFDRFPRLLKRFLGIGDFKRLRSFADSGISAVGPGDIRSTLKRMGLYETKRIWIRDDGTNPPSESKMPVGNCYVGTHWISRFSKLA